ncbi:MAG: AAA domain-containing protein [Caulobacteraceae bacterium]
MALLRSYVVGELPKSQAGRLALIDQMVAAQAAAAAFDGAKGWSSAFGSAWRDRNSDWDALQRIVQWRAAKADLPRSVWIGLAAAGDLSAIDAAREGLAKALPALETRLQDLLQELDLDPHRAFGVAGAQAIPMNAFRERLGDWVGDLEGLSRFIAFAMRAKALEGAGGKALVDGLYAGLLDDRTLTPAFDRAYAEALRAALFRNWPELRSFDGEGQNRLVEEFRRLDRARIDLAQEQIVAAHAAGRPQGAAGIGPLGMLNAEMARKRGHLPIRVLLEKAGPAIQQLKPVFMMSPLSVAQFLKPGGLQFDLLVMDEASQIEPVDALGAIARAQQIVVVGDEKQLPPTAFFKKLTGEDDPEETIEEGITIQAKDAESILELALAKGLPSRMLEWHYRSKHQSLIAVSNREFYENKLFIVPSPYDAVAGMGLKFNLLKDTVYGRGESRTNPKEARAVAEAVIRHARETPDQSLGVATFSVAQRQAVVKELELLRRANPDVETFFSAASNEPFFVKNLENLQGDERDVIFISVGYGKTETGYLAHAFGPLSGEGGERRLNVLISRAKLRCEVFCNFTGADIDLERTRSRGVAALKLFLTFAETGHFGLGEVTGEDFDSEFEAQVCERLQALGYDVKRQIGASGFRVDLAVSDPQKPGRFILGIECDGAQFHSSRSARDEIVCARKCLKRTAGSSTASGAPIGTFGPKRS